MTGSWRRSSTETCGSAITPMRSTLQIVCRSYGTVFEELDALDEPEPELLE